MIAKTCQAMAQAWMLLPVLETKLPVKYDTNGLCLIAGGSVTDGVSKPRPLQTGSGRLRLPDVSRCQRFGSSQLVNRLPTSLFQASCWLWLRIDHAFWKAVAFAACVVFQSGR